MEPELKLLEDIGLTKGEIKVYLALLRLGVSKTGPLAVTAGVSSSKVYKILDRLEKKGLAGHVMRGKIKFFTPMESRRILDLIDERQNELAAKKVLMEKMLPELETQWTGEHKTEATVYDGFNAVTNLFKNILDELRVGETYYVIGGGYGEGVPGLRKFFLTHHYRRKNHGIKVKMLANYDVKGNLEESTQLDSEIRFLPEYLITNMEIVFYKDRVFIAIWTREPKAFLLESTEAVKSFRKYFEALWKIAKP